MTSEMLDNCFHIEPVFYEHRLPDTEHRFISQ